MLDLCQPSRTLIRRAFTQWAELVQYLSFRLFRPHICTCIADQLVLLAIHPSQNCSHASSGQPVALPAAAICFVRSAANSSGRAWSSLLSHMRMRCR